MIKPPCYAILFFSVSTDKSSLPCNLSIGKLTRGEDFTIQGLQAEVIQSPRVPSHQTTLPCLKHKGRFQRCTPASANLSVCKTPCVISLGSKNLHSSILMVGFCNWKVNQNALRIELELTVCIRHPLEICKSGFIRIFNLMILEK
jgi:hypothetical protein